MNYVQLIEHIKKIATSLSTVKSFSNGDVYTNWNASEIKYGAFNIGLKGANRTDNTIRYNVVFYYGDRLLQDNSNMNEIWVDGINTIQHVLNNMSDDIAYTTPIEYVPFEQSFADHLAGVYARINLECTFDLGDCSIEDYIEEIRTLYVINNGEFSVKEYDKIIVDVETRDGITEEECREIIESYSYATESWVESKGYLTEHQSLDGYATEQWVEDKGYLTEHQDLSEYAKKTDIPSLDGYATESWVNNQGFSKAVFEFDEESATLNIITA